MQLRGELVERRPEAGAQLARARGTGEARARGLDAAGRGLDRQGDVGGGAGPGGSRFARGGPRLLARVEREAQRLAVVAFGDGGVRLLEGGVGGLELGLRVGLGAGGAGGVERALCLADLARRRLGAGDQRRPRRASIAATGRAIERTRGIAKKYMAGVGGGRGSGEGSGE